MVLSNPQTPKQLVTAYVLFNSNRVCVALQTMPGGGNKFSVRRDPVTGLYVALSNPQTPASGGANQRNMLQLITSPDLLNWCYLWDALEWQAVHLKKRCAKQRTGSTGGHLTGSAQLVRTSLVSIFFHVSRRWRALLALQYGVAVAVAQ